jgi:hypothetical protein
MKRSILVLAIAVASMAATAQPPQAPVPLTAATKKPNSHVTTVFSAPQPVKKVKVEHVEGMSSRPWAQIAGWNPGQSQFPDPERHEASFYLISVGHEPWR